MGSIGELQSCGERHLREFTKPGGHRSFATYDRQGDAAQFEPLDALAPALLDAPVRRDHVNQMWCGDQDNHYHRLRVAIQECLQNLAAISERNPRALEFANVNFSDPEDPWAFVRACFIASDATHGIKASKVSKMLHRKQPRFIPIIDSKLVRFYGLTMSDPTRYWELLAADYRANLNFLQALCAPIQTSEGLPLSPLRAADIIVWEHVSAQCSGDS